jgi:hypothetical protein
VFEVSVSKDMKKVYNKGVAIWKVVALLRLTLTIKELKTSVGHDRVVATLNIIKP